MFSEIIRRRLHLQADSRSSLHQSCAKFELSRKVIITSKNLYLSWKSGLLPVERFTWATANVSRIDFCSGISRQKTSIWQNSRKIIAETNLIMSTYDVNGRNLITYLPHPKISKLVFQSKFQFLRHLLVGALWFETEIFSNLLLLAPEHSLPFALVTAVDGLYAVQLFSCTIAFFAINSQLYEMRVAWHAMSFCQISRFGAGCGLGTQTCGMRLCAGLQKKAAGMSPAGGSRQFCWGPCKTSADVCQKDNKKPRQFFLTLSSPTELPLRHFRARLRSTVTQRGATFESGRGIHSYQQHLYTTSWKKSQPENRDSSYVPELNG